MKIKEYIDNKINEEVNKRLLKEEVVVDDALIHDLIKKLNQQIYSIKQYIKELENIQNKKSPYLDNQDDYDTLIEDIKALINA
jgi:hypothetical protein